MKILFASMMLALAGQAAAAEPIAFRAEARVEVAADGRPTKIEASADLPDDIRRFIEQKIATWQFSAPTRAGVVASGVTYLSLGACAIPAANGYRLAVDFKGNGPRIAKGAMLTPPHYPRAAMFAGQGASMVATYIVETNGHVTLESIEHSGAGNRHRKEFDAAIREWARSLRYLPEELAGQPVRTGVRVPIVFVSGDNRPVAIRQELRDNALRSPECKMAAAASTGLQPVAVDSPIRVLTSG